MPDRYVFIDETGDLGKKGSKNFIITAVWTDNPKKFKRLVKNLRRYKFKKQLKNASELKANSSSKELRENLLKKFNDIDSARAHSIILEKEKVYSEFLKNDKHKLYNYVCGVLASTMSIDSKHLIIRIDYSKGKQALREDFDNYIQDKCKENKWNRSIEVYHSWSHAWEGLQIADFVSWAVFQKFEHNNDSYLKIIEKKVNINHVWE